MYTLSIYTTHFNAVFCQYPDGERAEVGGAGEDERGALARRRRHHHHLRH